MTRSKQEIKRLADQRERQAEYRKRLKLERRPNRDDIARVLLHEALLRASRSGEESELRTINLISRRLVEQGFDKKAAEEEIENLLEKYTKRKWNFLRKTHLLQPGDGSEPS